MSGGHGSLRGSQPGSQAPVHHSKDTIRLLHQLAAMVLSASRAERQGIDVISIMEDKLKSFGYRVGLSDRCDNLFFTQQYFAQARYALEKGVASQDGKYVFLFRDYCLDYILEKCSGDLKPVMLWTEGFRKLVVHDIKGRADYLDTLRAYLDNDLNAQRTATALFISRNSFLSRLERINGLLNENLEDSKQRFRLELSLLLYDKYKVTTQPEGETKAGK